MNNKRNKLIRDRCFNSIGLIHDMTFGEDVLNTMPFTKDVRRLQDPIRVLRPKVYMT